MLLTELLLMSCSLDQKKKKKIAPKANKKDLNYLIFAW